MPGYEQTAGAESVHDAVDQELQPTYRIVGNAPDEYKEQILKDLREHFAQGGGPFDAKVQEQLRRFEYPLDATERACLRAANEITNELMQDSGASPCDLPETNVFVLPPELFAEITGNAGGAGVADVYRQCVLLNAEEVKGRPLVFAMTVLHEMVHFKGHRAYEVNPGTGPDTVRRSPYRVGWSAHTTLRSDEEKDREPLEHFLGLHEAVVSTLDQRMFKRILETPELASEKEYYYSEEGVRAREEVAIEHNVPVEDVESITRDGAYAITGYRPQRRVLQYVCKEISQSMPEEYPTSDAVLIQFQNAQFTGQMLGLGRAVEVTFGEGSFRLLASMTLEQDSANAVGEMLRKARMRVVRDKQ